MRIGQKYRTRFRALLSKLALVRAGTVPLESVIPGSRLTEETVIHAFQLILGRAPGSQAGIDAHRSCRDETELAAVLLRSAEFRASPRFKEFLSLREDAVAPGAPLVAHVSRAQKRVLILGNCQVATVGRLMQAMTGDIVAKSIEVTPPVLSEMLDGTMALEALLADSDLVFVHMMGEVAARIREHHAEHAHKLRLFPPLNYSAFHPDCVYVHRRDGTHLRGPMGDYHSSLVFWAWSRGWTEAQALTLFRGEIFEALRFDDHVQSSRTVLLENANAAGIDLQPLLDSWMRAGPWMHTINHPHLEPLADLTAELLRREGIDPIRQMGSFVADSLCYFPVWPVYPEIAQRLGGKGSYCFKLDNGQGSGAQPLLALGLEDLVRASFACYEAAGHGELSCDRVESGLYAALQSFGERTRIAQAPAEAARGKGPVSPYSGLPDHHFWRRSMELVAAADVDPVIRVRYTIDPQHKVATAGSCFAQHIARTLARQGFRYFVTEAGEGLADTERSDRQFGLFSARYGNVYTARQLVQLVERAYGRFQPGDDAWQRPDGRFVDPFRPQVEPEGFATAQEVVAAREPHFAAVRRMLEEADVFVFTLGLTEAWHSLADGAVFPLAPGVVAGTWDSARYAFVNFGVHDVVRDIRAAVASIRAVNPGIRFLFTVSPVPLIATYEDRHVLVSATQSKAVLRAAIAEVAASDAAVEYFPSFEIITGPHAQGRYFASDLRSVTDEGVAHVMKVFMKRYGGEPAVSQASAGGSAAGHIVRLEAEQRALNAIVCDEEAIERARQAFAGRPIG
jgi:hypothetical protein